MDHSEDAHHYILRSVELFYEHDNTLAVSHVRLEISIGMGVGSRMEACDYYSTIMHDNTLNSITSDWRSVQ